MKVTALPKHPEEVGDMEVIVGSYDETTPGLQDEGQVIGDR